MQIHLFTEFVFESKMKKYNFPSYFSYEMWHNTKGKSVERKISK